jgi:adenylate cyclase
MGFVLLTVAGLAAYLQRPFADLLSVLLGGWLFLGIGLAPGALLAARDLRPLIRWMRSGKPADVSPEAWVAVTRVPFRSLVRAGLFVSVATTANCFYAASVLDTGLESVPVFFLGVQVIIAAAVVFMGFTAEVGLSPIRRELAALLPSDFDFPPSRVGLRAKVLLALMTTTGITAQTAGGAVALGGDPLASLALGVVAGLATTAVLAGVLAGMVTSSVLSPVKELMAATNRVAQGRYDRVVPVTTNDELGTLSRGFNLMQSGLRERQSLHSAVSAYIDPAIAERLAQEGSRIPAETAEVTIMFVDIVGFTAASETASPGDVVSDLNEFFDLVIPAIERQGGHANKLLGDGLMAVFGVPNPISDHADRALAAAREIQTALAAHYGERLRAGVGLNSGPVVVGSMGGGAKLDYTIIGDAVNVAARVEADTRHTGDGILITDTTRALLADARGLQSRGVRALKGRAAEVELWAPDPRELSACSS